MNHYYDTKFASYFTIIYHDFHQNTIKESCLTTAIVKISIPKVKIAVLKNLLIFGEKYLPQSVRLLEGWGVETLSGRIPFEHGVSLTGASLKSLNLLLLKLVFFFFFASPLFILFP